MAAGLLMVTTTGCTEILGLGAITFHGEDAGPGDAGPGPAGDGGFDAGCNQVFYRDGDDDGYGDPDRTMLDCAAPTGYVDNADDCDDGTDTIAPGETELCDDVDQDCDGTLDEGLMGPVGPLVTVVVPAAPLTDFPTARVVVTDQSTVVAWHYAGERDLLMKVFDRQGNVVRESTTVSTDSTNTIDELQLTRFTAEGIRGVAVVWARANVLEAVFCANDGTCGGHVTTAIDGPGSRLEAVALDDRLIVSLIERGQRVVRTMDLVHDSVSPLLTADWTPESGSRATAALGRTVVSSPSAGVAFPRVRERSTTTTDDAGTPVSITPTAVDVQFVSVTGDSAALTALPWTYEARCLADTCSVFALQLADSSPLSSESTPFALEALSGLASYQVCLVPFEIRDDRIEQGECAAFPLAQNALPSVEGRGTVATVVTSRDDFTSRIQDIPLSDEADGSDSVPLPDGLVPFGNLLAPQVGMYGAHGAVLALDNAVGGMVIQRIGCQP